MSGQGAVETPRGSEVSAIEPPMSGSAAGSGLQRPAAVVADLERAEAQAQADAGAFANLAEAAQDAAGQDANRRMAMISAGIAEVAGRLRAVGG
jgi:hypothetical protein